MQIVAYEHSLATPLALAYSRAVRGVPHCYPIPAEALAAVDPAAVVENHDAVMHAQAGFLALDGADILGSVHVAVARPADEGQAEVGAIRLLWYARGQRRAGQALLAAAEGYLRRQGMARVEAFRYQHRCPFYHLPHALLSDRLDHVHALLGHSGYEPFECGIALDWPDYGPLQPVPAAVPVEIALAWGQGYRRPRLLLKAFQGGEQVGICVCAAGDEEVDAQEAAAWTYVRWLWAAERVRGQGLGRHLLQRGLAEMHRQGYRHAAICAVGDNYRALLLYGNAGFHAMDRTYAFRRELA